MKTPDRRSVLSRPQNLKWTCALRMYNSEKRKRLGWLIKQNDVCELCNISISSDTLATGTLANISHVNKLLITVEQWDSVQSKQHCWQMLRKELWLVRHGGCFRIPQRAVSRSASWRGGPSRLWRNLLSHSQGNNGPAPGETGCLTCSSVRRSDWCVFPRL